MTAVSVVSILWLLGPPAEPAPELTATEEFRALVDKESSPAEAVDGAVETYEAAKDLAESGSSAAKLGLVLLLLSAIFKTLLSVAKLVSKAFFQTRKGKTVMRLVTLGLGLIVLVITKVAVGMPWVEALFLALSGPGAIVVHELTGLFAGIKDEKDAQGSSPTPT
jgi:hypothetical protein